MINIKRSFKIEKMIAKFLLFKRIKGSGNRFEDKEDIRNSMYLGQIKATDTKTGSFKLNDLIKLEMNAIDQNKIPLHIVHFEREEIINSTWVSMPIKYFKDIMIGGDEIEND